MPLTTTDKVKINKYIRENKMGQIYYREMCDVIGKRGKVSDLEFLEYFTDSVLVEFKKDTKISVKHVAKLVQTVDTFLEWINNQYIKVPDATLDKIKSFEDAYQEYSDRTNIEMDTELTETYIKPLIEIVKKQTQKSKKTDAVTKYINQVKDLESEIKTLKKEFTNVQRQLEKSERTVQQKQEKLDLLGGRLTNATSEIKNKVKEIKNLEANIKDLNTLIVELETELKSKGLELEEKSKTLQTELEIKEVLSEEISKLKEELEVLSLQLDELQRKIKDHEKEKKQEEKLVIKENKLEALIYETLLLGNKSIDELVGIAGTVGIVTDANQVLSLLKRMRSEINISTGSFTLSPTYKVSSPQLNSNGEFNISVPYDTKYYDIMLVSDFHITEFDEKTLAAIDCLNDYCIRNNVKLVLNLGDFFEGIGGKTLTYDNAIKNYQLIEDGIKLMPKVDGIYHGILRGNHDRNIANYGFDPIEILTSGRNDLIDLGYKHSSVSISNPEIVLGGFGIHHPDTFDFPIDLSDEGIDSEKVELYLKETYAKNGKVFENSYIDIFGHTHKTQFNSSSSYCFVPSYFRSVPKRGAIHLRIYFDVDKQIKNMVFMPLSYSGTLTKNNEIIYQKKLTK